jgi:thiol-disulfide isomerase/thioredoxin
MQAELRYHRRTVTPNRTFTRPYHGPADALTHPGGNLTSHLLPFLTLALLLAACGEAPEETPAGTAVVATDDFVIEAVTAEELFEAVRAIDADIVVVNFWASWCAPCREEFPDFTRYDRLHDDVAVRFVSLDFPEDLPYVVDFLNEHNVSGTTFLKAGADQLFQRSISPDWTGSIPATIILDGAAAPLDFWEGKVSYDFLDERVQAARARI